MLEVTCLDGDDEDSRVWLTASGPPRPAEQLLTLYVVAETEGLASPTEPPSAIVQDCHSRGGNLMGGILVGGWVVQPPPCHILFPGVAIFRPKNFWHLRC